MLTRLQYNLVPKHYWISHLGAIHGCMNYLDHQISKEWLYGATGYAFFINIETELCPSGPTAFDIYDMNSRFKNIGVNVDNYVVSYKNKSNFKEKQISAFTFARDKIIQDIPVYGWNMNLPEFYTIHGVTTDSFVYCDFLDHNKEKQRFWHDPSGDIWWLHVGSVELADEPINWEKSIVDALEFAINIRDNEKPHGYPIQYYQGPQAYDIWIRAIENREDLVWGTAYNAACYYECRAMAEVFLQNLANRYNQNILGRDFEIATRHYRAVKESFKEITKIYPFYGPESTPQPTPKERDEAVMMLKTARRNEKQALDIIEGILDQLLIMV